VLPIIGILCGLIVVLTSIVVQIGWFTHNITLVQISPDFSSMKFNSAVCFLMCAINLIFFNSRSRLLKSTGLIATLLALITLSQYVLQNNNGIDSLFVPPFSQAHTVYPGRMSPPTGICFVVLGILLFIAANFQMVTSLRVTIITLTSCIIAIVIVPVLAYLSGIEAAYLWSSLTRMAVHTACSFIVLGFGLICLIGANSKDTPYFLVIPVVVCLTTAAFVTSGALFTYEDLRSQEFLKAEAYYKNGGTATAPLPYNSKLLSRHSSYIAYLVLLFGLLTSLLISLTVYFRLKWQQNAKALLTSEERLHLAITGTTDGLFDWNVATGEFYYSPRFEEVLGYAANSLTPYYDTFFGLIHPQDKEKFHQILSQHCKSNIPVNVDFRLKTRTGTYIWFNFKGKPTCDRSHQVVRMTGFIADISVRNEVDKMKNEFISTVSHELRTPMTSIRGSLSLILGNKVGVCDGKVRDLLVIADRNCDRLLRLINDILDIEKIESGEIDFKLSDQDLATIIKEAVSHNQMYASQANVKLVFFPLADIKVKVDKDRLAQVLTNLISNAVNFSNTGTTVTISMQTANTNVRVNVIDQGPGISEEFKKRIFQKFSQADSSATRDSKGSGLGLSISKAIMEELSGTLSFTTQLGQGTTFYFELPIVK
jgi:PAS domain S-box-containing protein